MAGFPHAPAALVVFGITGSAIGGLLLVVLLWHGLRRLLDLPRIPRGPGFYLFLVIACAFLFGGGVLSLIVAAALDDWEPVRDHAPLAEVRCQRAGNGAHLTVVPLATDGARGREETVELQAPLCDLSIARLTFTPPLTRLGEHQRITRMAGRPRPGPTPIWRTLPQPLGLPLATADDHQLSIPVEDAHPYRVVADGHGFRVERQ
jgi:hypothetical protein